MKTMPRLHHAKGCRIGRDAARGNMLTTIRQVTVTDWSAVTCTRCRASAPSIEDDSRRQRNATAQRLCLAARCAFAPKALQVKRDQSRLG